MSRSRLSIPHLGARLLPRLALLSLLLVTGLVSATDGGKHSINNDLFTSDVNLEHYYVIEENALSNADVLLRDDYFGADEEETAEEHKAHVPNLTAFRNVINETKTIHKLAGPQLESFLAHPINMYHLFHRLHNGWREGLDLLLSTKPCKKWNIPAMVGHLRYLRDQLPGKYELDRMVSYMVKLQKIYKLTPQQLAKGQIGGITSLRPLSLEDQFFIAKVMYEREDIPAAKVWLQLIYSNLSKSDSTQKAELGVNITDVLSLLASANYHLNNFEEAVKVSEILLEIDPKNSLAQNNLKFFIRRLEREKARGGSTKKTPLQEKLSKYERMCAREKPIKVSKKRCYLMWQGLKMIKMEVVRHEPHIVMFHDVLGNKSSDMLKRFAHEKQTDQAWVMDETFVPPSFSVELQLAKLYKRAIKRDIEKLMREVNALAKVDKRNVKIWGPLKIINVGLEGAQMEEHLEELNLLMYKRKAQRYNVGGYFFFLSDVKHGGEVVFPEKNIVVRPQKGSVLFYYTSMVVPHSFCPVIGGSMWVAVQPMYEKKKNYCVPQDEWK